MVLHVKTSHSLLIIYVIIVLLLDPIQNKEPALIVGLASWYIAKYVSVLACIQAVFSTQK